MLTPQGSPSARVAWPQHYAQANRSRFLTELTEFVRFPTISAQPKHADDMRRCATWLADHLKRIGLERVKVMPTAGHPVVYADWRRAPGRPTVLIYGHYDVQPVDPLGEWRSAAGICTAEARPMTRGKCSPI